MDFKALAENFDSTKVQVEVIEKIDGKYSPNVVVEYFNPKINNKTKTYMKP